MDTRFPRNRTLRTGSDTLTLTVDQGRSLIIRAEERDVTLTLPLHVLFQLATQVSARRELRLAPHCILMLRGQVAHQLARLLRHYHTPALSYVTYPMTDGKQSWTAIDQSVTGADGQTFTRDSERLPDWAWADFDPVREARQLFADSLRDHQVDFFHRRITTGQRRRLADRLTGPFALAISSEVSSCD